MMEQKRTCIKECTPGELRKTSLGNPDQRGQGMHVQSMVAWRWLGRSVATFHKTTPKIKNAPKKKRIQLHVHMKSAYIYIYLFLLQQSRLPKFFVEMMRHEFCHHQSSENSMQLWTSFYLCLHSCMEFSELWWWQNSCLIISTKNLGSLDCCRRKDAILSLTSHLAFMLKRSFVALSHPARMGCGFWMMASFYLCLHSCMEFSELWWWQNSCLIISTKNLGSLDCCRRKRYTYTHIPIHMLCIEWHKNMDTLHTRQRIWLYTLVVSIDACTNKTTSIHSDP